jgi:hypothetical protein
MGIEGLFKGHKKGKKMTPFTVFLRPRRTYKSSGGSPTLADADLEVSTVSF